MILFIPAGLYIIIQSPSGLTQLPNSQDERLFPPQITEDASFPALIIDDKENRQNDANLLPNKFQNLQDGYDLYDPLYVSWLERYHPESLHSYTAVHKDVPADQYSLACAEDSLSVLFSHVTPSEPLSIGTGGHSGTFATLLTESSAELGASLNTQATSAMCTKSHGVTSTPGSSDYHICRPSPVSSKSSIPPAKQQSAKSLLFLLTLHLQPMYILLLLSHLRVQPQQLLDAQLQKE